MASDSDLVLRALTVLQEFGIYGRLIPADPGSDDPAIRAYVELRREGRSRTYAVMVRTTVHPSTVPLVVDQERSLRGSLPVLLASEYVSVETAELLRRRNIQFMDTVGNAYINAPCFMVTVTGRRPAKGLATRPSDRIGSAALQVLFVLLRDAEAARLPVRTLGERAGVSHGAAAMALHAFTGRGWIRREGSDGHPVVGTEGMLSAWLVGFASQLGPRLEVARAISPDAPTPASWARDALGLLGPAGGLLGGEAAAEIAGHDIRSTTASVYVRTWDTDTMKLLCLVPASDGNITVRSTFALQMEDPADPRLVDPLLVLAELASLPDPRFDNTRTALWAAVHARFVA